MSKPQTPTSLGMRWRSFLRRCKKPGAARAGSASYDSRSSCSSDSLIGPGEYIEEAVGEVDVDINKDGVGYGYLRPVAQGYECGGGLFDTSTSTVIPFEAHPVFLFDESTERH